MNKSIDNLIVSLDKYYKKESGWLNSINNINSTYSKDFSVLLKQDVINLLNDFNERKEAVLSCILDVINKINMQKDSVGVEIIRAVDNLRINAGKIAGINFTNDFIAYGQAVNKIIEFFKTPNGQIYEKQLIEADKILKLWNKVLTDIKDVAGYMEIIKAEVIRLSTIF